MEEDKSRQYAAAGFFIGLVCGLALVALVIGGYIIVQRNARVHPNRIGQRVTVPPGGPATQAAPVALAAADLLVYEPFDADMDGGMPVGIEMQPGQFGYAAHLFVDNPIVYAVPGATFLREATIMGWVRIDNQRDRSFIWCYSRRYPSAFYYPDHQFKLGMHFIDFNAAAVSSTLAQAMQPGRYYHLVQSWGPDGFRTYLDGVPMLHDTGNRRGNMANVQFSDDDALYLGGYPETTSNQSGSGWKVSSDGIWVDDFAVFNRQLRADEVAGIAQSGVPLSDLLQ